MNILVSSCLLGLDCRYCAGSSYSESVAALSKSHTLIPVCPEQMGGLPTPRAPLERADGKVVDKDGRDFTAPMEKGAGEVLKVANLLSCTHAITKSKSPSCGCGIIYDGTFSRHLIEGNGVMTQRLLDAGIEVTDENHLSRYL
ncbi:MAG: DUF523 domain-containing protein [Eubacteriales bacterium]